MDVLDKATESLRSVRGRGTTLFYDLSRQGSDLMNSENEEMEDDHAPMEADEQDNTETTTHNAMITVPINTTNQTNTPTNDDTTLDNIEHPEPEPSSSNPSSPTRHTDADRQIPQASTTIQDSHTLLTPYITPHTPETFEQRRTRYDQQETTLFGPIRHQPGLTVRVTPCEQPIDTEADLIVDDVNGSFPVGWNFREGHFKLNMDDVFIAQGKNDLKEHTMTMEDKIAFMSAKSKELTSFFENNV